MTQKTALLCAGGTGGHLFPAEALAHVLIARGWDVHLATDLRAQRFASEFPGGKVHLVHSATFGSKNPIALTKTLYSLFKGYRESQAILKAIKPGVVVGFGGYPTVPPLFAANRIGIPTILHEQNAVLGRANRFLASGASAIAVGFEQVGDQKIQNLVTTGNPVRPMVLAVADVPYPQRQSQSPFNLLIFGGSQGARFFSEIFPPALELLSEEHRALFRIIQQARPEDLGQLKQNYQELGVSADISPFFKDMPKKISDAHLVVARAGASTVTEIAVIGRPALLVPFPGSLDGDQAWNAASMKKSGGADVIKQVDLTAEAVADYLKKSLDEPKKLALAAENAKKTAMPDAASKLADSVEEAAL